MATNADLERRLRALEAWANREALRRGALEFIVERMAAEHLARIAPAAAAAALLELSKPRRFMVDSADGCGPGQDDEPQRLEAASRQVKDTAGRIGLRAAELRARRASAADGSA